MVAIAIGQIGMSLEDFLRLTPDQFNKVQEKYWEQKKQEKENDELLRWSVARWQVWRAMCPPDKKTISQFDLIELRHDKELKEYLQKNKQKKQQRTPQQKKADEQRFRKLADKWN